MNGVQAGSLPFSGSMPASTGSFRLGGNSIWGEWFAGLIDEVRVYNRALSASEIQQDMQTPVGGSGAAAATPAGRHDRAVRAVGPEPRRPSAPRYAQLDGVDRRPSASLRYNVHRSTTAGFTPAAANRVGQPTGTSYTDSGLAAGTYYYRVTAEDAAGNISASSSQLTAAFLRSRRLRHRRRPASWLPTG